MDTKKYTKEQIVNFNPDDWVFRRSSGYSGYDLIDSEYNPKDVYHDESKWIYEEDFRLRKSLKDKYLSEKKFLEDFLKNYVANTVAITMINDIESYLDKRYFI